VPTHNRAHYAVHCIKSILALPESDIELVVHDSSDEETLADFAKNIDDARLRYVKTIEPLSMTENHNRAMELARGEYVCLIGDDDSILPEAIEITRWALRNDVLAISPEVVANYAWPDFRTRFFGSAHAGRLYLNRTFGRIDTRASGAALDGWLRKAALGTDGLPKIYHGIVHRSVLDNIRRLAGAYFIGTSPDASGALLVAATTDSFLWVDYPITLPGASAGSNTGRNALNKHKGTLEADPHTKRFKNLQWPDLLPRFVSVETVGAQAVYRSLQAVAPKKITSYNLPRLYATCLLKSPEYWKAIISAARCYSAWRGRRFSHVVLQIAWNFLLVLFATSLRLLKRGLRPWPSGGRKFRGGITDISACHAQLDGLLKADPPQVTLRRLLETSSIQQVARPPSWSKRSSALPLVSIVIPSYNHERYLQAAIDSVLAQDYPRIELIVIDDGSTDGSAGILSKYGERIRWEVQSNKGQVATLNKGWLMSRGEILGYLSADDLLLEGAVSNAVRCLEQHPEAPLVYCDFNLIDPDSAVIRRVRTPEFNYRDMVANMICPPGPGAFFRRSAFQKAGTWHSGFKQMLDYEYWLRLGLHGPFVRIPEVLAAYRVHPGSQTFASTRQIRAEEPVNIIQAYFEGPLVPEDLRDAKTEALASAHLHSAHLHFRIGNYRAGLMAIRNVLALYPRKMLSARAFRLAFNILFNRIGHRILWTFRRSLGPAD
jgi:glycosyltransferase involved in cell wall biosynthesis